MKFAISLCLTFIFLLGNTAYSQHPPNNNVINEAGTALLDIITKDTINPLQIKLDGDIFKFGLPVLINTKISLLKNKKDIYLQPLGTGKLYLLKKEQKTGQLKNTYQFIRIDSTYFFGANFNAINFFMNDTLFQFGGEGYWHIRGHLTYFSNKTHEWELYNANRLVIAFEDDNNNLVYHIDRKKRKLFE
jgi:hypothetical protein